MTQLYIFKIAWCLIARPLCTYFQALAMLYLSTAQSVPLLKDLYTPTKTNMATAGKSWNITHLCFFIGDGNILINGWFSNFPASHVSFQRGGISNQKAAFPSTNACWFSETPCDFCLTATLIGDFLEHFWYCNPRLTQLFFLVFFYGGKW